MPSNSTCKVRGQDASNIYLLGFCHELRNPMSPGASHLRPPDDELGSPSPAPAPLTSHQQALHWQVATQECLWLPMLCGQGASRKPKRTVVASATRAERVGNRWGTGGEWARNGRGQETATPALWATLASQGNLCMGRLLATLECPGPAVGHSRVPPHSP